MNYFYYDQVGWIVVVQVGCVVVVVVQVGCVVVVVVVVVQVGWIVVVQVGRSVLSGNDNPISLS